MISDADTIGVFQVESRAQMSMLPRLRPRCFYDLVIEVAIVRPGPIQGNMVHPYLRRRNGQEKVQYPSEALRQVLEKTLGVPLFQEQAMRVAMVGAGFSAEEADQLRRAMAAWRKNGEIEKFRVKIIDGMIRNGYDPQFAEQCYQQIQGFGEYGFPESHSASFALLVYVSAWLKRYHPAVFATALLNSQPMGFYAPAQIVKDARRHGVQVRPIDVNHSDWDCTLEDHADDPTVVPAPSAALAPSTHSDWDCTLEDRADDPTVVPAPSAALAPSTVPALSAALAPSTDSQPHKSTWGLDGPAMRLGFRQVKGLREDHGQAIVAARRLHGLFSSVAQLHRQTGLPASALRRLAQADAFTSLGLSRRKALWQVMELSDQQMPLLDEVIGRQVAVPAPLPVMPEGQEIMTDYRAIGLSLKRHPLALVRDTLRSMHIITSAELWQMPAGRWVKVAGLVLVRQRPGTASGVVFETLEDETGIVNLIIRPPIFDRYRAPARHAGLLQADGYVERQGQVLHVMVKRMFDLSHLIRGYELTSRDFH